ncbi:ABC transporter permease [Desulfosarcina sp.]|uniref:ABC transporter permease n=1 Tax=Desulfosarcina sp. TaxID=2027861 RepID=UPI003970DF59
MKRIARQRYFLDYTLRSLWRRRWKYAALIGLYSAMVFLIASILFFSDSLRHDAGTVLQDTPEVVVQRMVAGRHALMPVEYASAISRLRGARDIRPRLWGYYYHPASKANYTLMVPPEFAHGDDEIKIGSGVLRTWEAARNNQLFFKTYEGQSLAMTIAETFSGETDLVTADLILMSESAFRRITGIPKGYATDLVGRIRNPNETRTVAAKILERLPDTRPILREEIQRTYDTIFDWRSGYVLVALSGAVLAFFIFAWDKATGLSAEERAEIGILKGVGWETADVLRMKTWEGLVISLSAYSLGIVAAYAHVFLASAPLFEHALKGWAVLYPHYRLSPVVNLNTLAVLFFFTVMPYTLVTLLPTWRAAITDPDTVMRQL